MIFFKNLKKAINYTQYCHFCNKKLTLNQQKHNIYQNTLSFQLFNQELLHINILSNKIKTQSIHSVDVFNNLKYYPIYHSINILCDNLNCNLFDFNIQFQYSLNDYVINNICLSDERIAYEDKQNTLHEIKNNYLNNTTEYYLHSNHQSKNLQIPIIPLNFKNPEITVNRIKKLITFY